MTGRSPLPRSIGWLLRSVPLGDRRADVEHDFAELFEVRSRERGAGYATLRFLADFISLIPPLRRHRGLFQDLRFGLRLFRKHPGAIAIATIGLALAIGAVTSVYSILNAVCCVPTRWTTRRLSTASRSRCIRDPGQSGRTIASSTSSAGPR